MRATHVKLGRRWKLGGIVAAVALTVASAVSAEPVRADGLGFGRLALARATTNGEGRDVKVLDLGVLRIFGLESSQDGAVAWDLVATPLVRLLAFAGPNDEQRRFDLLSFPGAGGIYQWKRQGKRNCHRLLFAIGFCSGPGSAPER